MPLCVDFVLAYRDAADQFSTAEIGLGGRAMDEEGGNGGADEILERRSLETKEDVATAPEVRNVNIRQQFGD